MSNQEKAEFLIAVRKILNLLVQDLTETHKLQILHRLFDRFLFPLPCILAMEKKVNQPAFHNEVRSSEGIFQDRCLGVEDRRLKGPRQSQPYQTVWL